MDYLTLCQTARQRAGMSGAGPAQVTGNSGEMARLVDWVRQAWLELQGGHMGEWNALWRPLDLPVSAGAAELDPPADLRRLVRDRLYFDDRPLSWHAWRDLPRQPGQGQHPTAIAERPDGKLVLWQAPESAGTLHGEYYARLQVLENGDDEPWLPRHLQDAIIYQALIYYATYEDAPEIYQDARDSVMDYQLRMANELLPAWDLTAGPIA